MRSESGHRSVARRLVKVMAIGLGALLLLGGLTQSSVADEGYDELDRFPGQGLADPGEDGFWLTPQQRGVTYLRTARQWAATPTFQAVAFRTREVVLKDVACRRITQAPGARQFREYSALVTLVDRGTALDSPRRYGYTQSFQVRTVAFGSVPVEATVALEQPRNHRGVVIPATLKQAEAYYCAGQGDFESPPTKERPLRFWPAEAKGRLAVRIDRLKVDGVILPLATCRAEGATLTLTSREYRDWDPNLSDEERLFGNEDIIVPLESSYFGAPRGGLLFGSLDIPAFDGCVTDAGDDLSALLTASVSGEGNAVQVRTEGIERDANGDDEFDLCPFTRNCDDRFPVPELPTEPPS